MKQKIKIVGKYLVGLNNFWFQPLTTQYFDFEIFDETKTYDPKTTLFYIGFFDGCRYDDPNADNDLFFKHCFEGGFKTLYDNTWELHRGDKGPNNFVIHNPSWFWYNESPWYKTLNYDLYVPNKTYKKLGLMPLRRGRPHRDRVVLAMSPWLDDFYWSYVDHGRYLPNDCDPEVDATRYIRNEWYDDTYFSIIVETEANVSMYNAEAFLTEKTYKAIAFQHPFMVWGHPRSLELLKKQGFETFENLFDESYDVELTDLDRLGIIKNNVKNFERKPYDKLTLEKLAHNRNRFYDMDLIFERMKKEMIEPILKFAVK
jgi:hypothetical protein